MIKKLQNMFLAHKNKGNRRNMNLQFLGNPSLRAIPHSYICKKIDKVYTIRRKQGTNVSEQPLNVASNPQDKSAQFFYQSKTSCKIGKESA
jgi:hypothetical protein